MLLFKNVCYYALIAQLAEQIPLKDKVPGSIPGGGTTNYSLEFMVGHYRYSI